MAVNCDEIADQMGLDDETRQHLTNEMEQVKQQNEHLQGAAAKVTEARENVKTVNETSRNRLKELSDERTKLREEEEAHRESYQKNQEALKKTKLEKEKSAAHKVTEHKESIKSLEKDHKSKLAIIKKRRQTITDKEEKLKLTKGKPKDQLTKKRKALKESRVKLREEENNLRQAYKENRATLKKKEINKEIPAQYKESLQALEKEHKSKLEDFKNRRKDIAAKEDETRANKGEAQTEAIKRREELKESERLVKKIVRQTRDRLARKLLQEDSSGIRRAMAEDNFRSGKVKVSGLFEEKGPNSIITRERKYYDQLVVGVRGEKWEAYKAAATDPQVANNINHPAVKPVLTQLFANLKHEEENLQIESAYSFGDKEEPVRDALGNPTGKTKAVWHVPFSISTDVLLRRLFKGFTNFNKELPEQVNMFVQDFMAHVDNDWLKEDILETYQKRAKAQGIKEVHIPPTEEVIKNWVQDFKEGRKGEWDFHSLKFKDQKSMEGFISKWSDDSISGGLINNIEGRARGLAYEELMGGRPHPKELETWGRLKAQKLNEKQILKVKAQQVAYEGYRFHRSVTTLKALHYLNKIGTWIASSRAISVALSPFGDLSFGASHLDTNLLGKNEGLRAFGNIPYQLIKGGIDAAKGGGLFQAARFSKEAAKLNPLLHDFHTSTNYRFAEETSRAGRNPMGPVIKWLTRVDNGLRVVNSRYMVSTIRDHADLDFDALKEKNAFFANELQKSHGINPDDWDTLRDYAKNNEYLDAADFKGSMKDKISSLNHMAEFSAMPNRAISSGFFQKMGVDHPISAKVLGMFWAFAARTTWYNAMASVKRTENMRGISRVGQVVADMAALNMRSFVPSLISGAVYTAMADRPLNDYFKDKSTYLEPLAGAASRFIGPLWALIGPDGSLPTYNTSPYISTMQALTRTGKSAIDSIGDPTQLHKLYANAWSSFLNFIPYLRGSFVGGYVKNQLKQSGGLY